MSSYQKLKQENKILKTKLNIVCTHPDSTEAQLIITEERMKNNLITLIFPPKQLGNGIYDKLKQI